MAAWNRMEWNGMEARPKAMNHTLFSLLYFSNIQASYVRSLCIWSARQSMTIYTRLEILSVDIFLVTLSVLYVCILSL